jgi:uncharacterized protein (UPF0332 family)
VRLDNRRPAIGLQTAKAPRALDDAEFNLAAQRFEVAVGRAYYAAFHAARAALLTVGVQPRTHRGVNERHNLELVEPGQIEPEFLSIRGREQADRETADDSVEETITGDRARIRVSDARRFLDRIDAFLRAGGWVE